MQSRLEKLMQQLPPETDAAVIQSDVNRRYFTGMQSSAGTVVCFRDAAYLIIDFRYIEKARECVKDCTVIEQHDLFAQLQELFQKHSAKTVSVEAMEMTLSQFSKLKQQLGNLVRLDYSDTLSRVIYACRTVKSEEEIDKIRRAQRIAEIAFADICNFLRPGISERDVMLRLNQTMMENGSEGESFPTIALTGSATSMPHGVPSAQRIVQSGDFVLMDYGAMVDGYHSDMTRTVCVGKPSERMQQVYDIVLKAQAAGIVGAKPGITGRDMDKLARDIIEEAGYGDNFGHSLGHGVGLEIHEFPNASPGTLAKLETGNVVTVEPGIYLPGRIRRAHRGFCGHSGKRLRESDRGAETADGAVRFFRRKRKFFCGKSCKTAIMLYNKFKQCFLWGFSAWTQGVSCRCMKYRETGERVPTAENTRKGSTPIP